MTLELLVMQLINGLIWGIILALLASGLTLILGLMGVVNFAHGAFYMLGAYSGFAIFSLTHNFWLALVVAPLVVCLVGFPFEIVLLRRFYKKEFYYPLLLTFTLTLIFPDVIRIIFGTIGKPFDTPTVLRGVLGIVVIPKYLLFVTLFAVSMLAFLWLFLKKTPIGMTIRAATNRPTIVQTLGINLMRVRTSVFLLGISFAALSGVLVAPIQGIYPAMGHSILLKCFVVVIIGGMGSLGGAIIASLLIGVTQSLTTLVYGKGAELVIFLLLVVVILIRPSGLFGEQGILSRKENGEI